MGMLGAAPPANPADDLLKFLNQTIDWYRRVTALDQVPVNANELLYRDGVRQAARRVLRLAFAFARERAALLAANQKPATAPAANGQRGRNIGEAAATADQRVTRIQEELDRAGRQVETAAPTSRPAVVALRDKLAAELDLAKARRDVLRRLAGFVAAPSNDTAGDLLQKIDDLERSVPTTEEPSTDATQAKTAATTATASVAAPPQAFRPESSGVLGLVTEMLSLSRRMGELRAVADQAGDLRQANDKLRAPIRNELVDAIRRGESIGATRPSDDPGVLDAERQELEALATRFRQLSDVAVPLGEQSVLLDSTRTTLAQWRGALGEVYGSALRHLLVRLGAMTLAIVVLLGVSSLWRRATFRYVHDARRRVQFLLLRRVVVSVVMVIVIVAGIVTEFGSLATFAGIITAGIAVALQSVILSGAAYFFFIGRYGVRVGDRVTISGITGEVVDTGLLRLYLMELGGSGRALNPTGRIVVFSNSVLFQPSPFFKQVPGAEYAWHEVALTLSPETDYRLAEGRLMGAVEAVYAGYKEEVERQHEAVARSLHLQLPQPKPQGRLRFVDAGVEFVVRYPVPIRRAAEVDDEVTRQLLGAIEQEPKLRLVAPATPKIQPADVH